MAVAENDGGSIPAVREERAETARGGRPAFAATAAACRVSGVDRMVSAPRPEGTVGAREVGAPAHSAAEAPENVAVREFPLLGNNTSCFQTPPTLPVPADPYTLDVSIMLKQSMEPAKLWYPGGLICDRVFYVHRTPDTLIYAVVGSQLPPPKLAVELPAVGRHQLPVPSEPHAHRPSRHKAVSSCRVSGCLSLDEQRFALQCAADQKRSNRSSKWGKATRAQCPRTEMRRRPRPDYSNVVYRVTETRAEPSEQMWEITSGSKRAVLDHCF